MSLLVLMPNDDAQSRVAGKCGQRVLPEFAPGTARALISLSRSVITEDLRQGGNLLYFGHGERDALVSRRRKWWPFGQQVLCDLHNLSGAGRVVIAIACWSADQLGRQLVDDGRVEAYLGWPDRFSWPSQGSTPTWEAVTDALLVLTRGGTVGDCATTLTTRLLQAHDYYRAEMAWDPLAAQQAHYLAHRLYCGGNPNATAF